MKNLKVNVKLIICCNDTSSDLVTLIEFNSIDKV